MSTGGDTDTPADSPADTGDDLFADTPQAYSEPSVDLSHFSFDGSGGPPGEISEARVAPRFAGDTSELPAPVCYALQELIAAAHVSSKSRNWRAIEANEAIIRSRLSELNLLLEINTEYRYAFTRQVTDTDPRQRNILRASTLTLAASVLALYLRQKFLTSIDESATVERTEMIDHMLTYKPSRDTDEAGFVRRIEAAINVLENRKIIRAVAGTDRYLIHGVIVSLLTPEQVEAYTAAYRELSGAGGDLAELDDRDASATDASATDVPTTDAPTANVSTPLAADEETP
ncbi:DUF4194 domain-containing protein [Williamsia sp. CHRR-6]|uniref:DUF4194 domain-containing protein n=1 Tax=Williamsia sp. CHRR-6 TaxID=2835871 RepID=UPI001BD94EC5|nr:DUF4194 domain-containing protein [Williamsia sp. CHRR-6]MBT0567639.1 DUF4194 domain-containing protein [Williamsia sp. CHRR-6]